MSASRPTHWSPRRQRRLGIALGALAAALLVASSTVAPARAGACCMSASAVGTGRLLNWEDGAVGLNQSVAYTLGEWTADGQWRAFDDYEELELRTTLWGMARLTPRTALSLSVPAVINHRSVGPLSEWGGFLGDVSLGFRWDPRKVAEDTSLVPAIAVLVGVIAPTGQALGSEDAGKLGEGATGRGTWVISAGVAAEVTSMPWFGRVEAHVNVPLPGARGPSGTSMRFGPGLSGSVSGGYAVSPEVTVALAWRWLWESENVVDGQTVDNSQRVDMGLALSMSWRFHAHWTMTAAVDSGVFADHAGDNGFGRISANLGLRYGIF